MPPANQPETPAAMFGAMVKHYRERAGLSQLRFAEAINYSEAHVASVETGRRSPRVEFAQLADNVLDTGGALVKLHGMFLAGAGFLPGFQEWTEYEARATMIRGFEPTLVPGLLQTEEYMEVVFRLGGPEAIEAQRVRQRRVFEKEHPPVIRFVLDEWVLRHPVGDAGVMDRQLEHLEQLVVDGQLHLQVIPSDAFPAASGVFTLATVDDRTIGYEESITEGKVILGGEDLQHLEVLYDHLLAEADTPARSLEKLRNIRNELWKS